MSDVPELDRLLDETDAVRVNQRWERRERLWRLQAAGAVLAILLLPLLFLLGETGAVLGVSFVSVALLPVLVGGVFEFLVWAFQPATPRNPTKRYVHK